MDLKFDNQVVIVTGAARGIGRDYALFLGARGARVVVNNRAAPGSENQRFIDQIVTTITQNGGQAIPNYDDVTQGSKIVDAALRSFGRVDVLINNAGIIKDSIFAKLSDQDWDDVLKVHLEGTYQCCKAVWNHMLRQGYGRIVNTISGSGMYGQLGQANYSAAKFAIIGLSLTLAQEGLAHNILVNMVSPVAASRMTETIMPPDVLAGINAQNVAPLVAKLAHRSCNVSGAIYETSAGFFARIRLLREEETELASAKL